MPFVLIQFLPTRPSLGLQAFLIGKEKPLCIFSLLSTSLRQSSLTARGRKLYALRMASGYWETLFHLYKNSVQCGKQRTPVSPESQPQYCKCARDGTAFCHNLSDAVRQRFAAYYPGRKTQRERSATTGSAGVMRILSCCSHNQPAEVEEKSSSCLSFSMVYTASQISSVSTSSDSLKTTVSSRPIPISSLPLSVRVYSPFLPSVA